MRRSLDLGINQGNPLVEFKNRLTRTNRLCFQDDPPPDPPPTPPAITADGWKGQLDEGIRSHPSLASFEDNAEGLLNAAKSYVHVQPVLGLEKIAVPGKDSPKEVVDQAFQKLGWPETVEGYGYERPSVPEGYPVDEDFEKAFLAKAHELRFNAEQLKGMSDFYYDYTGKAFTALTGKMEEDTEKTDLALRRMWGKAYTQNAALADKVMATFGDKDFTQYLEETGLGNSTAMIKFLATVGKAISEDKMVGKPMTSFKSPDEARAEISKLRGDAEFMKRYNDKSHPEHKAAVDQLAALHGAAYPEE